MHFIILIVKTCFFYIPHLYNVPHSGKGLTIGFSHFDHCDTGDIDVRQ
jgi:hypothetical protein